MEIGCGARVRDFDRRRYFYFWHYERDDGHSTRKEDYVGRVDSEKARSDLLRRMAAYHRRAEGEDRGPRRGACLHLEIRRSLDIPRGDRFAHPVS